MTAARLTVTPTPAWKDPLATPGDQFPLGPPQWWWDGSEDKPSTDPAVRPFSMRGLVDGPSMDDADLWTYEYRIEHQTAIARNSSGTVVPLYKHTKPGVTPAGTTGVLQDSTPHNPPPEEMGSRDYQSD